MAADHGTKSHGRDGRGVVLHRRTDLNVLKYALATAVLAAPVLCASGPAQAIMSRQYAMQGQGLYITSKGVPEGYIGVTSPPQQGFYGNSVANPPRDLEHHNRYFGGF
jgi:hypothetical protein